VKGERMDHERTWCATQRIALVLRHVCDRETSQHVHSEWDITHVVEMVSVGGSEAR